MVTRVSDLIQTMLKPGILLFGVLFFLINAHFEYVLYHVNTYKMFVLGLSVLLLYIFNDLIADTSNKDLRITSWQAIVLLALPTIATIPGYLWHDGHNYNFRYELVTDIFLLLWAGYVFRVATTSREQTGFFAWIVPLMVFITGYSVLEFYGLNPLSNQPIPTRPKATFGNINYFSGFLATLIPIFLLLSLPKVFSEDKHYSLSFDRVQLFFLIAFVGLVLCAVLAQSRAALGAAAAASLIAITFWAFVFLRDRHRFYVIVGVIVAIAVSLAMVVFAIVNPEVRDIIIPGRFSNLFHENAWQGRTSPLISASRAFLASPWIGWGLGSSYNLNFLFMPVDTELYLGNRSYNHVHNEFLEMAEEGGVLMLVTWALLMLFIFWKLCKIAIDRSNDGNSRIIAIGCLAGIMAFYGHGVFSVAQRMIVANLPFYSLLGIAMSLIYTNSKAQRLFIMPKWLLNLPQYFWRFGPSSLLILVGWILFIPVTMSFYNMNKIRPQMDTLDGVIMMEKHMKSWPNPYGLDDLMSKQLELKRYEQALQYANIVKKIIPEYRNLGYKESVAYFFTGQTDKAKERLKSYQKRIGYDTNAIIMLGGIALETKDQDLFVDQLERLLRRKIISQSAFDSFNNKDDVSVKIDDSVGDFELTSTSDRPGNIQLTMSSHYVRQLSVALIAGNAGDPRFLQTMANQFASQQALIPPVKDKSQIQLVLTLAKKINDSPQLATRKSDSQRKAYLRSFRPKNKAEQIKAIRELSEMSRKVWSEFKQSADRDRAQLKGLLAIDNIEDYLTLTTSISAFLTDVNRMSFFARPRR